MRSNRPAARACELLRWKGHARRQAHSRGVDDGYGSTYRWSGGLLTVIIVVLLASCATLDENECRSVDWFDLGQRDGADGYAATRIGDHREACSEFGLGVDQANWRRGYDAGLESYCTIDNGYAVGRRGMHYGRVCPAAAEGDFLAAFALGRETYDVEQEMAELGRRIGSLESRLSQSDDLSDEARLDTRRFLGELYRQMSWLRRSRDRLEFEWRTRY